MLESSVNIVFRLFCIYLPDGVMGVIHFMSSLPELALPVLLLDFVDEPLSPLEELPCEDTVFDETGEPKLLLLLLLLLLLITFRLPFDGLRCELCCCIWDWWWWPLVWWWLREEPRVVPPLQRLGKSRRELERRASRSRRHLSLSIWTLKVKKEIKGTHNVLCKLKHTLRHIYNFLI